MQALKSKLIDGIVVDMPTAFYVTVFRSRTPRSSGGSKTVGAPERFGVVLPKGSTLTSCVNRALDRLWLNGTIKQLQRIWLPKTNAAPVLK